MSGTSSSFVLRLGLVSVELAASVDEDEDDDGVSDDWRAGVAEASTESAVLGGSVWISGGVEVKSTLTSGLRHTDRTELVDERETDSPFKSDATADGGKAVDDWLLSWSASWTY